MSQKCSNFDPPVHLFCLQERPDLSNLKSALVVSNAKMKAELAALESRILGLLSASSGNILEDEELINTLAQAKVDTHLTLLQQSRSIPCCRTAMPSVGWVLLYLIHKR